MSSRNSPTSVASSPSSRVASTWRLSASTASVARPYLAWARSPSSPAPTTARAGGRPAGSRQLPRSAISRSRAASRGRVTPGGDVGRHRTRLRRRAAAVRRRAARHHTSRYLGGRRTDLVEPGRDCGGHQHAASDRRGARRFSTRQLGGRCRWWPGAPGSVGELRCDVEGDCGGAGRARRSRHHIGRSQSTRTNRRTSPGSGAGWLGTALPSSVVHLLRPRSELDGRARESGHGSCELSDARVGVRLGVRAEVQVVAVRGGFLCAFPVFKPVRLVDGHSDVAVVRVSRR